jgi:hypothetical protein
MFRKLDYIGKATQVSWGASSTWATNPVNCHRYRTQFFKIDGGAGDEVSLASLVSQNVTVM